MSEKAINQLKSLRSDVGSRVRAWGKYASTPQPGDVATCVRNWQAKMEQLAPQPIAADPFFEKAVQAFAKAWDERDDVSKSIAWVKAAAEDLQAIGETKSQKSVNASRVEWVGNVQRVQGEHPAIDEVLRLKRMAERANVRNGRLDKGERQQMLERLEELGTTYAEAAPAAKSAYEFVVRQNTTGLIDALDTMGVHLYQSVLDRGETLDDLKLDAQVGRRGLKFIENLRAYVGMPRQLLPLARKAYQLAYDYDDSEGQRLAKHIYVEAKRFDVAAKAQNPDAMEMLVERLNRGVDALEAHWRTIASKK